LEKCKALTHLRGKNDPELQIVLSFRPFAFKSDTSFLEKISAGAVGALEIQRILNTSGHNMVELERESLSMDIWQLKMKRIRVPDLVCTKCGSRAECRAKTNLEITMSHADTPPDRRWDAGLLDGDWVIFIRCEKSGPGPTDWSASDKINAFCVSDLRATTKLLRRKARKGATEGSELQITWPSRVAPTNGIARIVGGTMRIHDGAGKSRLIRLSLQNGTKLVALVKSGDQIVGEQQFVAAPFPYAQQLSCGKMRPTNEYVSELFSTAFSIRYTAAKVLGDRMDRTTQEALFKALGREREPYVALEIAGALTKLGHGKGIEYLTESLERGTEEIRFRTCLVLAEVNSLASVDLLTRTLTNQKMHPEVRAVAARALGFAGRANPDVAASGLVKSFESEDIRIKKHAAKSILNLHEASLKALDTGLGNENVNVQAGAAWCLGQLGELSFTVLRNATSNSRKQPWVALALGLMDEKKSGPFLASLSNEYQQVIFAAHAIQSVPKWIWGLEA
jgi:HEAT repeat protein